MAISDPKESKVKMSIMTKGKNKNQVWYSPIKQNKKRAELIINGMMRRFMKTETAKITNVVLFYDNQTDSLLAKAKL